MNTDVTGDRASYLNKFEDRALMARYAGVVTTVPTFVCVWYGQLTHDPLLADRHRNLRVPAANVLIAMLLFSTGLSAK